jgi:hypothetical protein
VNRRKSLPEFDTIIMVIDPEALSGEWNGRCGRADGGELAGMHRLPSLAISQIFVLVGRPPRGL